MRLEVIQNRQHYQERKHTEYSFCDPSFPTKRVLLKMMILLKIAMYHELHFWKGYGGP